MAQFFVTCAKGIELPLVDELKALGASDAREALAGAHFSGGIDLGYRACLESRLASRVLLRVAEFDAADADALYAGVMAVDWSEHLIQDATLAVDAVGVNEGLRNSQFIAQRVKDAVVDQCRDRFDWRPGVDTERPSLRLNLALRRERANLNIDLSGGPLHQRGYRRGTGLAPLKENLACAMLVRAGWPQIYASGGAIVDPLCGSATLLIEAALMAADVAPGLKRPHFGFLGWKGFDAALWKTLLEAAQLRANVGLTALRSVFFGFDHDAKVLGEAKANAQAAGVSGFLHLGRQSLEHLKRPHECTQPGLLICNPPYGERMGADEALYTLYRELGERMRSEFAGWHASVITSSPELGKAIGLRAEKMYQLYNGALECRLLNFDLSERPAAEPRPVKPLSSGGEMLRNRLEKNLRHLRKTMAREGISCYRAYDADLPEYAAAIDIYERHLHIQEYAPPDTIPEETARTRLRELVRVAGEVCAVPRENIAVKTRLRGKGGEKYGRMDQRGEFFEVGEGGLRFEVNLRDYLDTGLFLDHRPLRARIRELARGKRFLNLFCYTATASVYAAAGGATSTTSVDLSATYLDWASRNFVLNGLGGREHELIQGDCLEFMQQMGKEYDIAFVDPPTFSNSKRAEDFDVQRDHVRLLRACVERLAPGATILFSNNFRRFKLDMEALADLNVRDISASTIPADFARNPRIHRCWQISAS
jgi:23S rRNA (guanine2445-N2)-methyltransferase / 23S rRNA (guanine2069-N7)-methyltransferase